MVDADPAFIRELCGNRCQRLAYTEVERLEEGAEVLVAGTPPPPLCAACPEHDKRPHERRIRHVEVVRNAYKLEEGND